MNRDLELLLLRRSSLYNNFLITIIAFMVAVIGGSLLIVGRMNTGDGIFTVLIGILFGEIVGYGINRAELNRLNSQIRIHNIRRSSLTTEAAN